MKSIECVRVDPPAKPSREEMLRSALQKYKGMNTDVASGRIEADLKAWEADPPAPTYRIEGELSVEDFDALAEFGRAPMPVPPIPDALSAILAAFTECAYAEATGSNDGEGLAEDHHSRQVASGLTYTPDPYAEAKRLQSEREVLASKDHPVFDAEDARRILEIATTAINYQCKDISDLELQEAVALREIRGIVLRASAIQSAPEAGTAGATDYSGEGEQRSGPMSDYDIGRGAFLQYVETGDECYIANMRPDEMREVLRTLGDVRQSAIPLSNRCPGNTVTAEELAGWWQMTSGDLYNNNEKMKKLLARFFPEHIARQAEPEPVAVQTCGKHVGVDLYCVRPKGHGPIFGDGTGCRSDWPDEVQS